jgi:hypothetical protein
MKTSNVSTAGHQKDTLNGATRKGEEWSALENEFLSECRDLPQVEVAEALGRTLYAVANQYSRLERDWSPVSNPRAYLDSVGWAFPVEPATPWVPKSWR